jgi:hypothetical protein
MADRHFRIDRPGQQRVILNQIHGGRSRNALQTGIVNRQTNDDSG